MKKLRFTSLILIIFFLIWMGLSLFRTMYNFSKLATEERSWYFLSDEQKRAKQFGDLHSFLRFVQTNTKQGSNILFFTHDLKNYYLGRYYLYPTKVIGEHEKSLWKPKAEYYDYILVYPVDKKLMQETLTQSNVKKYKKLATYRGTTGQIGILYKK